jgi:hypothetical protein
MREPSTIEMVAQRANSPQEALRKGNQSRRNEEHEVCFFSFFVFFVSSRLIPPGAVI